MRDIFAGGISQAYIGVGGFATLAMRIREFASILTFRRTPQISARRFYGVGLRFLFAPELLGCSSGCSRNCPILAVWYVFVVVLTTEHTSRGRSAQGHMCMKATPVTLVAESDFLCRRRHLLGDLH